MKRLLYCGCLFVSVWVSNIQSQSAVMPELDALMAAQSSDALPAAQQSLYLTAPPEEHALPEEHVPPKRMRRVVGTGKNKQQQVPAQPAGGLAPYQPFLENLKKFIRYEEELSQSLMERYQQLVDSYMSLVSLDGVNYDEWKRFILDKVQKSIQVNVDSAMMEKVLRDTLHMPFLLFEQHLQAVGQEYRQRGQAAQKIRRQLKHFDAMQTLPVRDSFFAGDHSGMGHREQPPTSWQVAAQPAAQKNTIPAVMVTARDAPIVLLGIVRKSTAPVGVQVILEEEGQLRDKSGNGYELIPVVRAGGDVVFASAQGNGQWNELYSASLPASVPSRTLTLPQDLQNTIYGAYFGQAVEAMNTTSLLLRLRTRDRYHGRKEYRIRCVLNQNGAQQLVDPQQVIEVVNLYEQAERARERMPQFDLQQYVARSSGPDPKLPASLLSQMQSYYRAEPYQGASIVNAVESYHRYLLDRARYFFGREVSVDYDQGRYLPVELRDVQEVITKITGHQLRVRSKQTNVPSGMPEPMPFDESQESEVSQAKRLTIEHYEANARGGPGQWQQVYAVDLPIGQRAAAQLLLPLEQFGIAYRNQAMDLLNTLNTTYAGHEDAVVVRLHHDAKNQEQGIPTRYRISVLAAEDQGWTPLLAQEGVRARHLYEAKHSVVLGERKQFWDQVLPVDFDDDVPGEVR